MKTEIFSMLFKWWKQPFSDGIRYIELGNRGLMLNVITPLQKFSRGGATISDVLRQRFHDVFQREMSSDLLMKSEEIFTKSKEVRRKFVWRQLEYETYQFSWKNDIRIQLMFDEEGKHILIWTGHGLKLKDSIIPIQKWMPIVLLNKDQKKCSMYVFTWLNVMF